MGGCWEEDETFGKPCISLRRDSRFQRKLEAQFRPLAEELGLNRLRDGSDFHDSRIASHL